MTDTIDAAITILRQQKADIDATLKRLEDAKREADRVLASTPAAQQARHSIMNGILEQNSKPPLVGKSITDAAEIVLREAGHQLHVGSLHDLLGVGGKVTTRQSIVSSLLRDKSGRFRAYGRNTYGLAEWPDLPIFSSLKATA